MKKITINRLLSFVLAVVMLLSLGLTGCKKKGETTDPDGTQVPEGYEQYTFTAKGKGALALPDVTITVTDANGNVAASGKTDVNGKFSPYLYPGEYTARITDGLAEDNTAVDTKVTGQSRSFDVIAHAVVMGSYPKQPTSYKVGDVMWDFSYRNEAGEPVRLSELLQTKKMVVINFWATWCSPCKKEFPAIQKAYEEYGDEVEVVAFSTSDNATKCDTFKAENGYTFNMVPNSGLYARFSSVHGGASIPCTIFVDRYGMIAYGMVGGDDSVEAWKSIMAKFTADDYTPDADFTGDDSDDIVIEKPNVDMPASSEIEAVVNGTNSDGSKFSGTYIAPEDEYTWPWIINDEKNAIRPSNYGKHGTKAMISMELDFKAGEVFSFDYAYSIDYDEYGTQIYDYLAVYVDGHVMQTLYTKQNGKVTCYAYTPVSAGKHTVTLLYSKDTSTWLEMEPGKEYVNVSNLRMVSVSDMTAAGGSLNVWMPAADGVADENASTSYLNYVNVVKDANGYYHVDTVDGPLLLAKLTGPTQWSSNSLYELGNAGYLKIDGVDYFAMIAGDGESNSRNLMWLESHAKLNYTPVNDEIIAYLDLFADRLGEGKNHDKEWLEFCSYFLHYGVGNGVTKVTDVRQGIDLESAFTANEGRNYVYVNQTLVPRGLFYKFVPSRSGVYHFYSSGSIDDHSAGISSGTTIDTEAWILAADGTELRESQPGASGHFKLYKELEAGKTYYIVVAFASTEDLGWFDLMIDYKGANDGSYDIMVECGGGYTTDLSTGEMIIWRNYGIEAALDSNGYYRQVLGYNPDGTPILDMSEHGYMYVDFLHSTELISYIPVRYGDGYCTLKDYIEKGYATLDSDGKVVYVANAFDFTQRTDDAGNSLAELGNHQAEMEEYLRQALANEGFEYGYVRADQNLVEIINDLVALYGEGCKDEWLLAACFALHP